MKDKIIAALRTKYQRFGLSNEAVDRIASAKEKTVTNESDIETAIADAQTMELIANELQKSADAERRKHSTLQKSFEEYKEKHPEKNEPEPEPDPDSNKEPEWAKKLRESNERIEARYAAEDAAKKNAENLSAVEAKLKADGCSNPGILKGVLKGFALGKDESVDDAAVRLKNEYNETYKETFGKGPQAGYGGGDNFGGDPKKAAASMNDYLIKEGLLPSPEQPK